MIAKKKNLTIKKYVNKISYIFVVIIVKIQILSVSTFKLASSFLLKLNYFE